MAENPNPNKNTASNQRKATKNSFFRMRNRFSANRGTGPRPNAVSVVIPSDGGSSSSSNSSDQNSQSSSSAQSSQISTPPRPNIIKDQRGPYSGWHLYFPETSELYTFL